MQQIPIHLLHLILSEESRDYKNRVHHQSVIYQMIAGEGVSTFWDVLLTLSILDQSLEDIPDCMMKLCYLSELQFLLVWTTIKQSSLVQKWSLSKGTLSWFQGDGVLTGSFVRELYKAST